MTTFDKYVEGTDVMNYVTNAIAQLTGAVTALCTAAEQPEERVAQLR